jgi:cell division protein FtsL
MDIVIYFLAALVICLAVMIVFVKYKFAEIAKLAKKPDDKVKKMD